MKFVTAQKLFSLVFLAAVFGAAVYNFREQRVNLETSVQGLLPPLTEKAARADIGLLDDAAKSYITGQTNFMEAYAYIQKVMGKNEIDNFSYIRAKNGALNFGNFYDADITGLEKYAARLRRMKEALAENGGGLIFLTPPDLIVWDRPEYASGMPYRNANPLQDAFLDQLREYGVDYLDARYSLKDSGLPADKIMYRTDHHWTNEACFEVFRDLVAQMEERHGMTLDPAGFYRDHGRYGRHTYPESFLGFLGRSTGIHFSGLEDFTIIWPRFEGEYLVEYIDKYGFTRHEGPPEKSILNPAVLGLKEPYNMTMYDFYLYGIKSWMKITNKLNPDGPKLLLIHDSFGPPLASFLAPMFSEIHMMWPPAESFTINIDEYMAGEKFDFAVVELYPYNYNEQQGMRFFVEADNTDDVPAAEHTGGSEKE